MKSKSLMVCCYDGFECNSTREMIQHAKEQHLEVSQVCYKHAGTHLIRLLNGDVICPTCFSEEEKIKLGVDKNWISYPSIDAFIKSLNTKKRNG